MEKFLEWFVFYDSVFVMFDFLLLFSKLGKVVFLGDLFYVFG